MACNCGDDRLESELEGRTSLNSGALEESQRDSFSERIDLLLREGNKIREALLSDQQVHLEKTNSEKYLQEYASTSEHFSDAEGNIREIKTEQNIIKELSNELEHFQHEVDVFHSQLLSPQHSSSCLSASSLMGKPAASPNHRLEHSLTELGMLMDTLSELGESYGNQAQTAAKADISVSCSMYQYRLDPLEDRLHNILRKMQKKMGKCHAYNEFAVSISPLTIVDDLEKYMDSLLKDLEEKKFQIRELENDQEILADSRNQLQQFLDEHQARVKQLTVDYDKQLQAATERSLNSRLQASSLAKQLAMKSEQHEEEDRLKDELVSELEAELKQQQQKLRQEQEKWMKQFDSLSGSYESLKEEYGRLKDKRELMSQQTTEKMHKLQSTIAELKRDLAGERERRQHLEKSEQDLRVHQRKLKTDLAEKNELVIQLNNLADKERQEFQMKLQGKMTELDIRSSQVQSLTSQVTTMTDKYNNAALNVDIVRAESDRLQQQVKELQKALADRDKLSIRCEEMERSIIDLQHQQSDSMTHILATTAKAGGEQEQLIKAVSEKVVAMEHLRLSRDTSEKKLKMREARISELEEELRRVKGELCSQQQQQSILQEEEKKMQHELEQSQLRMGKLRKERDYLKKSYLALRSEQDNDVKQLTKKLNDADQNMKLMQNTFQKDELGGSKVVKIADKLQKELTLKRGEIDQLHSSLWNLQEKMELLEKEKFHLEKQKSELKTALNKVLLHRQELAGKVDGLETNSQQMRSLIYALESDLQMAEAKHLSTQTQADQYKQQLACMKLKYQLEVKEKKLQNGVEKSSKDMHAQLLMHFNDQHRSNFLTLHQLKLPGHFSQREDETKHKGHLHISRFCQTENTWNCENSLGKMSSSELSMDSLSPSSPDKVSESQKFCTDEDDINAPVQDVAVSHKPVPLNTDQLCRNLGKKIDCLNKLGGNLQKENKEMASLIKVQGRKLHKMKETGKETLCNMR